MIASKFVFGLQISSRNLGHDILQIGDRCGRLIRLVSRMSYVTVNSQEFLEDSH